MNNEHTDSTADATALEASELANVRGGMIRIPLTPRPPSLAEQDMPQWAQPPEVQAWREQTLRKLRGEPVLPIYRGGHSRFDPLLD